MSAWSKRPTLGSLYSHRPTRLVPPVLYRVVSVAADSVVLRPVAHPNVLVWEEAERFERLFQLVDAGDPPSDDLMALAEAVGVARTRPRTPGEQPLSEFTAGPRSCGPVWSDDNLAREFFGGDAS